VSNIKPGHVHWIKSCAVLFSEGFEQVCFSEGFDKSRAEASEDEECDDDDRVFCEESDYSEEEEDEKS